jgi:hypothetical protein
VGSLFRILMQTLALSYEETRVPRPRSRVTLSLLGLCLAAAAVAAGAQEKPDTVPAYRNRLLGVFDMQTGAPLEGALVKDLFNKTSSLTTKTGTIGLFFLPDGGGFISVTKIGYAPQTMPVAISPADTQPITVVLERVTQLGPVTTTADAPRAYVSPSLRGFEERRKSGFGRFIPEAQLRKDEGRDIGSVLRTLAGLTLFSQGTSDYVTTTRAVASMRSGNSRRPPPPCRSTVYLDGMNIGAQPVKQLPQLDDLAGIEWYASVAELPAQFNATGNACGVLLLWTRER